MIARLWTGQVPVEKSEEYLLRMRQVALPDYKSVEGNLGAWCLHRRDGDRVTVAMLTFWRDLRAIRRFAGTPEDVAKYYDFDAQFLLEMPERVQHFEVVEG
jgi:heme-degrading monooxygenase HmoA